MTGLAAPPETARPRRSDDAPLVPPGTPRQRAAKRAIDLALALVALIVLSPVAIILIVAIRLDSTGPVLFKQDRIGRDGRRFRMWKFRTMVADAEQRRSALLELSRDPNWLQMDHDPRVTRVGRLLRTTSLDELPQLVNVVRGEMSLVGPRPLIPLEDDRVPGWARRRNVVAPGMTGLWQVSGRNELSFEEMLRLDCRYVESWSPAADLSALVRTPPAVLLRRGAS